MAQQTFRTAFNGFNREDVVRYIEYLNAQHAAEISRLNSELAFLRSKAEQEVSSAAQADEAANAETAELIEQQATRIRELFDQNKAQEQTIAKLTADLEQALQQQTSYKSHIEEELGAYRRAERTERLLLKENRFSLCWIWKVFVVLRVPRVLPVP